jgi:NADP-dependent 3-hydroxy acid dehydrogenase YdfG
MKQLNNKTVALTGAASGIGRALSIALAKEGCHLALADKDSAGLEVTHREIRENCDAAASAAARRVTLHTLDVANRDQVYDWADSVIKAHGQVDVVINNAGVALSGSIEEMSIEDFNWVFDIVFYGVLYGTKAFLPFLRQRPQGHVVNISSVNGFFPFPNNSPYNCAKHAVKAFNQTLIQELESSNIKVTSVHPGGIRTNIVNNSRFVGVNNNEAYRKAAKTSFQAAAKTTPEKAAQVIIKGIKRDKQRLLVGFDAYVLDWLNRLFPQGFSNAVGRIVIRNAAKE